jgi:hypothetical protein
VNVVMRRSVRFPTALSSTLLVLTALECGCQSNTATVRQTRIESISVAPTGGDSGPTTARKGLAKNATSSEIDVPIDEKPPAPRKTPSASPSTWSKLFGKKDSPQRLILPRDDRPAANSSAARDKRGVDEF